MNLTPEEKAAGQANYEEAVSADFNRRKFLQGTAVASLAAAGGLGAAYFGYSKEGIKDPVRVSIIGTGDEGGVLIGALNPDYMQVVSICDIRPYNQFRAFYGDNSSDSIKEIRKGLMQVYGWKDETEAKRNCKVETDYKKVIEDPNVEAVIIALPLHLHGPVAIEAMRAGKHVLTEKLMGRTVAVCKDMARTAKHEKKYLSTGHQRHYSVLYENARNLISWGLLGQIHFIQAQWHRGNLPGSDSWKQPLPGGELLWNDRNKSKTWEMSHYDEILEKMNALKKEFEGSSANGKGREKLQRMYEQWVAWNEDRNLSNGQLKDYGYSGFNLDKHRAVSPMELLCRWRLFDQTGGGLMAELGSHQLDASSIFIAAARDASAPASEKGKKVHPLSVHAIGGKQIFPNDRHADDHVYATYEFPGPHYDYKLPVGYNFGDVGGIVPDPKHGIPGYDPKTDPEKKIVVSYTTINGSGFGGYGEVVMGTKGDMVVYKEQEVTLHKSNNPAARVSVKDGKGGPTLNTQESGPPAAASGPKNIPSGPVSRGYKEEMEHFAWVIRTKADPKSLHCHPEVALGDAVIALTTNVAIANNKAGKGGHIVFNPNWFDSGKDDTPDGSKTAVKA